MSRNEPLGEGVLSFLRDLKRNNNREWFQENKERYIREHRDPLLRFIEAFDPTLKRISPHYVADPRRVGGSLFRIYRDTRFSRDKRPYKTHAGILFRHEAARHAHAAPGFYLHVDPAGMFVGLGMWHPESDALKKVRDAIVEDPAGWKRASTARAFRSRFELAGESLKRPPRGYDSEHPHIEDLKRKDFIAMRDMGPDELTQPDFPRQLARNFQAGSAFVEFLTRAVGLPW